ncbi:signal peptidase I [Streptomyces sp. A3M-1-3]|uniref:signal peptidase I n=1 Tax=Streptomyces sp. A3M-1-3 TaxID=2962044 RepID=UPI0020B8D15B|nr:signal peptidase I [Streptomyces sp. A3M-1-3]MCP3816691.1 signal peptidase I [Streptomyces sp. A3M-1-3]
MSGTGRTGDGHGRLGSVLSGLAVAVGCVFFLGGFVWGAIVYQPYTVPSDSMTPTVNAGDRVLAERIDGSEVKRGDVVVFTDSVWSDMPMVKRVVAIGGDTVACCGKDGKLTLNGKALDEPYLRDQVRASTTAFEATVPEGRLFLLGDERSGSLDSRVHVEEAGQGSVPRSAVSARVDATAWPLGGTIERPQAFAELPGGISQPGPVRLVMASIVAGAVLILGGAAYGPLAKRAGRAGRAGRGRRERAGAR